MKYRRILGLLAVAVAAMMAFAASASATTVTTTTGGSAETPTIHAVSEEDAVPGTNHVWLHNPIANVDCNSTFSGTLTSHGSGVTAGGPLSSLSFSGCTNGWTVTVNNPGSLEIHYTSGHNGTLTSSGMTTTATYAFPPPFNFHITCRYATNNTHIGTITGGNPATIHLEAALPFHSGSGSCDTGPAYLTGSYATTSAVYIAP